MSLARMRIDELVNAWVGERYTPFQLGLLGVFDAGPWKRPGGTIDVARLRLDLAGRAGGVADLRRRALDAALRGSSLVGGRSGVRRCPARRVDEPAARGGPCQLGGQPVRATPGP